MPQGLLPEEAKRLPTELVQVDGYLDDERFLRGRRHRAADAGAGRAGGGQCPPRAARPARGLPPWAPGGAAGGSHHLDPSAAGPDPPAACQGPGDSRSLVSLADPDARPIRKGKPGRATEFGYTVLLGECERGFMATHHHKGNPPDAAQLVGAVTGVIAVTGRPPGTVAGDRGFRTAANDAALAELGVARIGLARTGTPGKARRAQEQTRRFRRMRNCGSGSSATAPQSTTFGPSPGRHRCAGTGGQGAGRPARRRAAPGRGVADVGANGGRGQPGRRCPLQPTQSRPGGAPQRPPPAGPGHRVGSIELAIPRLGSGSPSPALWSRAATASSLWSPWSKRLTSTGSRPARSTGRSRR
jgi:hypothetical protein